MAEEALERQCPSIRVFYFRDFFISVIKYLPRSNVKREGFVWIEKLEALGSVLVGRQWRR